MYNLITKKPALPCFLCFIYALVNPLDFRLMGMRVTGGEPIALIGIIILLQYLPIIPLRPIFRSVVIILLYIVGTAVSDLVIHQNHYELFLRGVAKPLFILMIFLFFYICFCLNPKSYKYYLYTAPFAILIYLIRPPKDEFEESVTVYNYFVSVIGPVLFLNVRLVSSVLYTKARLLSVLCFLALAPLMALYGSRSDAFLCILVAVIFFVVMLIKRTRYTGGVGKGKMIFTGCVALLTILGIYNIYIFAAPKGYLGEMQMMKYERQTQTVFGNSPLGLILSGRTQSVALFLAGKENPIWGLGSWPDIYTYYVEALAYADNSLALDRFVDNVPYLHASGHSAVLGSWASCGIFGLIFWLYLAIKASVIFKNVIVNETLLTPWLIPACVMFYWHWAFSPIGTGARQGAGIFLALSAAFFSVKASDHVRAAYYEAFKIPKK